MPTTAMMIEQLVRMRHDPDGPPVDQFWLLVERFRADLVNQALAQLGNQQDAEDVAQETLCVAYLDLNRLRDPQKLGHWLRTINRRIALSHRERKDRRKEERLATAQMCELVDPASGGAKRAAPSDRVLRAVDALPEAFRQVVVLRYWEKLSTEEIAARLDIPAGTVRSRLTRADGMLAQKLKGSASEEERRA
ncbi:MAG: sigma-70 family RNA polymerase sigma factor [Planctomycetota bacterium]|nr:sigma-70 family RNA polymerase sigma factor [Planctomycetota bacterium]